MPKPQLPQWATDFYTKPYRFKIAHGGRGSSKSWTFALMILMIGRVRKIRVLCTREIQVSIKASVYQLLVDLIHRFGWVSEYEYKGSYIRHVGTGTYIFFGGLKNNPDSIKSAEGVDLVWIEEAQTISENSMRLLIPTVRKKGSEIWMSCNPRYESDYVYKRFIKPAEFPSNVLSLQVNWKDNPWFGETELHEEMEHDKNAGDLAMYLHIWEGHLRPYGERPAFHSDLLHWNGGLAGVADIMGLDLSYSGKNALVGLSENTTKDVLRIETAVESTKVSLQNMGRWLGQIDNTMVVDSARPEVIKLLRDQGYSVRKSKKGAGSVLSGIDRLNRYTRIEFMAGTELAMEEFSKLGFDENEHLVGLCDYVDATRYGVERISPVRIIPWAELGGRAI